MENEEYRELVEHNSAKEDEVFKRKTIEDEKQDVRKKLSMSLLKQKVQKSSFFDVLQTQLRQSGSEKEIFTLLKELVKISALFFFIIALIAIPYAYFTWSLSVFQMLLYTVLVCALGFPSIYGLVFVVYRISFQLKAFRRRLEVERVLPDYLRLVAINHRSGLNLDAALLQSNRKSFGLLAEEMERVIKQSRVSGDLAAALENLGKRFDSKLLTQTFKSLAISVRNGSNVSQLLDDMVDNIQNMRLLRKDLVANVQNYIIFILVSGLIIMPSMLALSAQMNDTISTIKQDFEGIDLSESQLSMLNLGDPGGASPQNYLIYVIFLLTTNSLFVALLLSAIKYGNVKQNIGSIPTYIALSFVVYFVASYGLSLIF